VRGAAHACGGVGSGQRGARSVSVARAVSAGRGGLSGAPECAGAHFAELSTEDIRNVLVAQRQAHAAAADSADGQSGQGLGRNCGEEAGCADAIDPSPGEVGALEGDSEEVGGQERELLRAIEGGAISAAQARVATGVCRSQLWAQDVVGAVYRRVVSCQPWWQVLVPPPLRPRPKLRKRACALDLAPAAGGVRGLHAPAAPAPCLPARALC